MKFESLNKFDRYTKITATWISDIKYDFIILYSRYYIIFLYSDTYFAIHTKYGIYTI